VSALTGHSRDQLRRSCADAWQKRLAGEPLTPLEAQIAEVVELHPEYHALLADSEHAVQYDAAAAAGRENPFLHLGLHLAVREQVAIDRPPGVRQLLRRLQGRCAGGHAGEHALMEALAETLWQAQRAGRAPDEQDYLERARARLAQR
jgi:hypothetical protein